MDSCPPRQDTDEARDTFACAFREYKDDLAGRGSRIEFRSSSVDDASALISPDRLGSFPEKRNLENPFVAVPCVSAPSGSEITNGFSSDHEKLLAQDVG